MTSQAGAGQARHSMCAHKTRWKCVVAPGKWLHQTPSSFAARRLASCCCPATLNCRACPAAASRVPAAPTARSRACAIAASVIAAELPVDPPSPSSPSRGDVRGRSVPANAAATAPHVAEVAAARLRAPDPAAATATATATSEARVRAGAAAERGAAKHGGTVAAEAAEAPVTGCALLPASLLVEDLATLVSVHAQSPEGLMQLDDTRRVLGDLGRLAAAGTEGGTAAAALRPWADRLVDVCWKGWVFGWNREDWPGSEDEHGWQDEDEEARSL